MRALLLLLLLAGCAPRLADDDDSGPTIDDDDSGTDEGAVYAVPESVDFGYIDALGFSAAQEVAIVNGTQQTVEVSVELDHPAFMLQLVFPEDPLPLPPGAQDEVWVFFAPPAEDVYEAPLVFETDHPGFERVEALLTGCSIPDCAGG